MHTAAATTWLRAVLDQPTVDCKKRPPPTPEIIAPKTTTKHPRNTNA